MKILTIVAYHNGAKLGKCHYTTLKSSRYESARRFMFWDFKVENPYEINNSWGSWINFSIYLTNKEGRTLQLSKFKILLFDSAEFQKSGDIQVYGHILPDDMPASYNQYEIDVLHSWDRGWEIDWESPMLSNEQKEYLLKMRLAYSGRPKSIEKGLEIYIDGERIFHPNDFYCCLNDEILGPRGCLGMNYTSLDNILLDIHKENPISASLKIKRPGRIEEALGKRYFELNIELLERYGIAVEFI